MIENPSQLIISITVTARYRYTNVYHTAQLTSWVKKLKYVFFFYTTSNRKMDNFIAPLECREYIIIINTYRYLSNFSVSCILFSKNIYLRAINNFILIVTNTRDKLAFAGGCCGYIIRPRHVYWVLFCDVAFKSFTIAST
jgi:hypothetical protein